MAKKHQDAKSKRSSKHGHSNKGRSAAEENNEIRSTEPMGGNKGKSAGKSRKHKSRDTVKHLSDCDDAQLFAAIEADGSRTIVKMADDGNCLFRSLSDQLYSDWGTDHTEVRSEVCDFLESHEDEYAGFLVLDDEDGPDSEDAKDFASYVSAMRQDGEWGGNLELVVAARLYRRNIVVFSANLAALTIEHDVGGGGKKKKPSSGPDLLISYHDNQHYNSVRQNNNNKSLPRKKPPPHRIKTSVRVADDNETVEVAVEERSHESFGDDQGSEDNRHPDDDDDDFGASTDDIASVQSNSQLTTEGTEEDESIGDAMTAETAEAEKILPSESHSQSPPLPSDKRVRKNSSCPCGSGLRYKKCCWAKEKHAARVRNLRRGAEGGHNSDGESQLAASSSDSKRTESRDDEPQELHGGFRVLKI